MAPLVSVIIPAFNAERFLSDAISSAIAQEGVDTQIIVIDDGSKDDTAKIAKSFESIQLLSQSNSGPAAARNNGLNHAKGDYVAYLESDDLWLPGFLAESVSALESHQEAFMTFSHWVPIDETGKQYSAKDRENLPGGHPLSIVREVTKDSDLATTFDNESREWNNLPYPLCREQFIKASEAVPTTSLFRGSMLKNRWREDIWAGEDRIYVLENMVHACADVVFTFKPLCCRRFHSSNLYWTNSDLLSVSERDLLAEQTLLQLLGPFLSKEEHLIIKSRFLQCLLDSSYHQRKAGNARKAFSQACRAAALSPNSITCAAVVKSALSPLLGGVPPTAPSNKK